jgi:hypothetical protein
MGMKLANTNSVMWPVSILANRRTLWETGRQERQHFDKYDQRQDVDRDALGHEQVEEVQPILPEAVDDDREEHQQRQRGGDDDVAHHRELVGNEPDDVRHRNEHEQREHQREEPHPAFRSCRV